MTKPMGFARALVILGVIWAVIAGIWIASGKLVTSGHVVDVLHATDAAMRIADGQHAHLDFLTPLGVLAFLPITWFLNAGFGADQALVYANIAIPLLFVPAIAYVAASRMTLVIGVLFALFCLVLGMGGVYGGTLSTVSMSLYYNRWAWMVAFIVVAAIMLDPKTERPILDGIIIGACLSFLALVKMSYFVAFAPVVVVGLLTARNHKFTIALCLTGLLAMIAATIVGGGFGYWAAYAHDLNFVRMSDVRPKPGADFTAILSGPKFIAGTAILLAAVIALRQAGQMRAGLLLMVLVPGFAFITYQNWGNDPKWLMVMAVLCFMWAVQLGDARSFGTDARSLFLALGIAASALTAPSFINILNSPARNFFADLADFTPIIQGPRHDGLRIQSATAFSPKGSIDLSPVPVPEGARSQKEKRDKDPVIFGGVEIAECGLKGGYFGNVLAISNDLKSAGFSEATIGFAGAFNPLPLVGGFAREPARPVWYYGGQTGLIDADFVVVPTCSASFGPLRHYLNALSESGTPINLVHETPHYRLFALNG